MHEGEQHGTYRGQPGPAIIHQQFSQGAQAFQFLNASGRHITHNNNGNDDFVRGEAENKRHQNHAVQPDQAGKRIQKFGAVRQQTDIPHGNVRQNPDQQTRRSSHRHGTAKHEKGTVKNGADNHFADLRAAIGGEFQRKRRGNPLQDRFRQKAGNQEGHTNAKQDYAG